MWAPSLMYQIIQNCKRLFFFFSKWPRCPLAEGGVWKQCSHAKECCAATQLTSTSTKGHIWNGVEKAERLRVLNGLSRFLKNCVSRKLPLYSKIGEIVDCKSTYFEHISLSVYVGSGNIYGRSLGFSIKQKRDGCSVSCWMAGRPAGLPCWVLEEMTAL